jgi:hypothetical protein
VQAMKTVGVKLEKPEAEVEQLVADWKNHRLSAFAYLTWLHHLTGRSVRNARCHPIFP